MRYKYVIIEEAEAKALFDIECTNFFVSALYTWKKNKLVGKKDLASNKLMTEKRNLEFFQLLQILDKKYLEIIFFLLLKVQTKLIFRKTS